MLRVAHEESLDAAPVRVEMDAPTVGRKAEEAILSLPIPRGEEFEALYGYVVVDEPSVHLMPLHFLPRAPGTNVDGDSLLILGVAAKLEYARNRWLDEIVDVGHRGSVSAVHGLDGSLIELIHAKYAEVMRGEIAGQFFGTLASLYARHGTSLAVDGSPSRRTAAARSREGYETHARCRHASFRASVDAVLLLSGASAETMLRARQSWHMWALGVQFWDDAIDAEEDFGADNLTWTVARTLSGIERGMGVGETDRDAFYERALEDGVLIETLRQAESCFAASERLAEDEFPSWANLQRACISQTSELRTDLQSLASVAAQRRGLRTKR